MVRPHVSEPRDNIASLRLTVNERREMEATARVLGFKSLSDYIRHLHNVAVKQDKKPEPVNGESLGPFSVAHETRLGKIYSGNSLEYLHHRAKPNTVNLIVTSPPFGLVRKKSYGNEDAAAYCEWFRPFAEGFNRVLRDDGSLVIDIGGAWKPGMPTRSLYHFKLLIMLCEEFGFHLAQEHYWWNPAKLPSPAEWVNIRRVRVKDAVNCVWWLSKTPYPKANNKRVLAPYSDSMRGLLKNGYKAKLRPSGHDISEKFSKDNGGSVPPNLLAIANTESNGQYQDYCRKNGIDIHPARFPSLLPEYFIRMLTDPGDLVVDPFAGSCVTGMVAESLRRKWACIELSSEYIRGAMARFQRGLEAARSRPTNYSICTPCSQPVDEALVPLVANGGSTRLGGA
ncbi:site-specific DNA-methyltransferase (cytosine-N4-specific) [Cupriavidus gilardii J11]|uniref:Methyltransferase n=1 Tax=Cupriavidus gilardii J11 TaxID=936133 RepID=A0A562BBU9_9BURK|nr:site-specific DNA-methyltransferase [Cupriavidus gilardii]TWG82666.1 site-specific DNA-methyltransferase (cytosine-N4-specific) [Cupriavidus gilardii J11]